MPVFDAKRLDTDPDLAVLAALLHPTPRARAEAIARGRERVAKGASAFTAPSTGTPTVCLADAPAA